jgi:hypothetical protein
MTMTTKVNEIRISYREKIRTQKSEAIKSSSDAAKLLFKDWNTDTI